MILTAMVAAAAWGGAAAAWAGPDGGPVERLRGIYLQQAIELATVGDRLILLTRMTSFRKCGGPHGIAEDYNAHTVEVLGRDVPGIGFVAGVVDATDGCRPPAAGRARDARER
jgi:hypothetical protein